ncbi:hypothetical protein OIU83_22205 [Flavobacterium sp. LS1R49]|uniref:Uncharacterized protein n=1 Tax=Flavobacterium shii TaxID=2987687 RepID=A0A9X3C5H5_9FLAO|nr:hypothetical protein [Flavobacterium shii]MCV9930389.1 hypothetical protein [Flavobacterium shii]
MNRVCITLLLLALISCKKESATVGPKWTEADKKQMSAKPAFNNVTPKIDTIHISGNGEIGESNYILASFLDKKIDKDSLITVQYKLDFFTNKTKIGSEKVTIVPFTEGSAWGASYGLSKEDNASVSPFIQISFGYEACGYNQQYFLFYLKNNKVQLVHDWDSMSDGGWGSWLEFGGINLKNESVSFYSKRVSYGGKEGVDDEEMGTVEHSDSTLFHLKNNKWEKRLLTPKGKVYWKKDISFNEFYPQTATE